MRALLLGLAKTNALNILALHGGGGMMRGKHGRPIGRHSRGDGLRAYIRLRSGPSSYGGLWIRDLPASKENPTTDRNWASAPFAALDALAFCHGPFDGIMGYSARRGDDHLVPSQRASSFSFAVTYCGYAPTTHTGLMGLINAATPMSIPHAFYYGTADYLIVNSMTTAAAAHFSTTTMISDGGGHDVPQSGSAVTSITNFVLGFNAPSHTHTPHSHTPHSHTPHSHTPHSHDPQPCAAHACAAQP